MRAVGGAAPPIVFATVGLYTFFLYSRAVEFIDSAGTMHLMMLTAVPAVLMLAISGRMLRGLQSRIGVHLALFTACTAISIPFSIWKGGSFAAFIDGWPKSFIGFLLIAGVLGSLKQLRQFSLIIAFGLAAMLVITNRHALQAYDDRLSVQWGTLGNSNDLATIMLIGLPFCLYVVTDKRRMAPLRLALLAVCGVCVLTVLRTGSRGALLAMVLVGIMLFFRASASYKVVIAGGMVISAAALPFILSADLRTRYMTIFEIGNVDEALRTSDNKIAASALASSEVRRNLLKHALQLSATHPLFGVGYGVFPAADAGRASSEGQAADWHEVHNVFAMVLVENGLPALIFYAAAVFWCFRIAAATFKRARQDPAQSDLARFALCLLVSLTFYFICNNFATDAYDFQLPLLGGIAAAIDVMSKENQPVQVPAIRPWLPRTRRGRPKPLASGTVGSAR